MKKNRQNGRLSINLKVTVNARAEPYTEWEMLKSDNLASNCALARQVMEERSEKKGARDNCKNKHKDDESDNEWSR